MQQKSDSTLNSWLYKYILVLVGYQTLCILLCIYYRLIIAVEQLLYSLGADSYFRLLYTYTSSMLWVRVFILDFDKFTKKQITTC